MQRVRPSNLHFDLDQCVNHHFRSFGDFQNEEVMDIDLHHNIWYEIDSALNAILSYEIGAKLDNFLRDGGLLII